MERGKWRLMSFLVSFMLIMLIAPMCMAFGTKYFGDGDQELTVYGYLRNNTGYFSEDQPYALDDDKLAAFRTSLRLYTDLKFSEKFKIWGALNFAYEPEYDVEEGADTPDCYYCDYDSFDDVVREALLDFCPNKRNSIKFGRQIAIWGEALTSRVGDVIHPEDSRWTMAFANLEDTRIPQWMARGIHDINVMASSFEWIVMPLWTGEEYRVNRGGTPAMLATGTPGQRFAPHPEDRFLPPEAVGNQALVPIAPGVAGPPLSRSWAYNPLVPGSGWVMTEYPHVTTKYPEGTEDTRFGFRTSSYAGGYQFGLMYWHSQSYMPVIERGALTGNTVAVPGSPAPLPERDYTMIYPDVDIVGFYGNKQLPWPGVIRTEAVYSWNQPFNTFDLSEEDAVVERDQVKYLIAYDLNSFLYFDWHKTAPIDIVFEHIGEWIPDSDGLQFGQYATEMPSYSANFGLSISTNWFYNRLATSLTVAYNTFGNSLLLMPVIEYMPGWMNNSFSFELKYVGIEADSDYEGLGAMRTKDMVGLTVQFNF